MEEWEFELRKVLTTKGPLNADAADSFRKQIVEAYARRDRKVLIYLYVYMGAFLLLFAVFSGLFWQASSMKMALMYGILGLIMIESTILVRLWYWIVHTNISTLRELKQLQLQIAETSGKTGEGDS